MISGSRKLRPHFSLLLAVMHIPKAITLKASHVAGPQAATSGLTCGEEEK